MATSPSSCLARLPKSTIKDYQLAVSSGLHYIRETPQRNSQALLKRFESVWIFTNIYLVQVVPSPTMENTDTFVSHLPRFHSGDTSLSELVSSATNARDGSRKHYISNLPEPTPKRKTLVERAGEPQRHNLAAPPSTRLFSGAGANATMHPPRNFSQSYRSNSGAARTISGSTSSSVSTSVGPASYIKRPSVQVTGRPKIALAKDRITSAELRPSTALDSHGRNNDGPRQRKLPNAFVPMETSFRRVIGPPHFEPHRRRSARNMPPPSRNGQYRLPLEKMAPLPACVIAQRNTSLETAMRDLSIQPKPVQEPVPVESPLELPPPETLRTSILQSSSPTKLPRPVTPAASTTSLIPLHLQMSSRKSTKKFRQFLTKDSNLEAWDTDEKYSNFERMYEDAMESFKTTTKEAAVYKDSLAIHKNAFDSLQRDHAAVTEANISLRTEVETTKFTVAATEKALTDLANRHATEIDILKRQMSLEKAHELAVCEQSHNQKLDELRNEHQESLRTVKMDAEDKIHQERSLRIQTLNQASTADELHKQQTQIQLEAKDKEIRIIQAEADRIRADLERERMLRSDLQQHLAAASTAATNLEFSRNALQHKIEYLESDSKTQSESYAAMEKQMNEALDRATATDEKLRKAETRRRQLHDEVQRLKGNIQVICRQRPPIDCEKSIDLATMTYPDIEEMKAIEVTGPEEKNSLGKIVTKKLPFTFDRAFGPNSTNENVYEEISSLVQSAIDGYNVCIFAYGQTGSGKTHTMSSSNGVMPRAVHQIYESTKQLEETGWKYRIQGSFVEVYNEIINDLLFNGDNEQADKKKHEIRHDTQKCETTITDATIVELDSKEEVEGIVGKAMARRSVAATKLNERSSRSHSVFILKLSGHNSITGESSKGTLNLVDLAGSERVSRSKVEGERLKETQNINKSLSCLGDVIGALGAKEQGAHIPYRNSKLTYLLQYSLGGNSKTLMFVMVSPLKEHLGETLGSLKFATKVHSTRIGTAKRVSR